MSEDVDESKTAAPNGYGFAYVSLTRFLLYINKTNYQRQAENQEFYTKPPNLCLHSAMDTFHSKFVVQKTPNQTINKKNPAF